MSTIEDDVPVGNGSIPNKRQNKRSEVWRYYEETLDERAICKSCGKSLSAKKRMGTSHLKRHIETCQNNSGGMSQIPFIDWQEEEILVCNIVEDPESFDRSTSNKKQKRSEVWNHFQKTPDHKRAVCEHCGKSFSCTKGSGTSHLKRHIERCEKQPIKDIDQPLRVDFEDEGGDFGLNQEQNKDPRLKMVFSCTKGSGTSHLKRHIERCEKQPIKDIDQPLRVDFEDEGGDFGLNQEQNKDPRLKMAIMAEIPLLPSYCKTVWHSLMGPTNFDSDVCDYYQNEKTILAVQLKNLTSRVNFTCEMSGKVEGYISITSYFINEDFNLVKRLIGFKKLCDSGIVAAIGCCISDWKLEDKIFTFTLNSGLDQSEVIDSLRAKYSSRMLFDGQYIHLPWCKTTLVDFVDQCFYSFVLEEGKKIKEFFESLTSIPSRMSTFNKLAKEMGFPPVDVIWLQRYGEDLDSVVRLLKDVILYKDVVSQYLLTEIGRWHFTQTSPCCINWKQVELAVQFIRPIRVIVNGWIHCLDPTPNLYFQSLLEIRAIISNLESSISETGEKISKMKNAIAEQLGACNELLFIACVLDPRFKLVYLEYCFDKVFESNRGKVKIYRIRECLRIFFDEYAQKEVNNSFPVHDQTANARHEVHSSNSAVMCHTTVIDEFSLYKKQVKKSMRESELDEYLSEDAVDVGDMGFNLLAWWKQNRLRYPVLSRIARDILAMPTFRSIITAEEEVNPQLVEAVMCSKAWIISNVQSTVPESKR